MDRKRELALIEAVQKGDAQAFGELYNANVDRVYRFIYVRVSSAETAEDLTSDVFLRVLEGLPSYKPGEIPLLGWIYRIAQARLIDYYRRGRQKFPHTDIDHVTVSTDPDMDEALTSAEESQLLETALQHLSHDQQQVVILRFIEGYNLEMTAQLLNKSVGAVKITQFRAIQKLSQLLTDGKLDNRSSINMLGSLV